jgi:DNA-binding XRE family transcriptional regulator
MSSKDLPYTNGETISQLRLLKGIKQAEAAKRLSISQQGYSKIETYPLIAETTAKRILAAFACNEQDLENIKKLLPTHTHTLN